MRWMNDGTSSNYTLTDRPWTDDEMCLFEFGFRIMIQIKSEGASQPNAKHTPRARCLAN